MRRLLAAMVVLSLLVLPSGGYALIEVNNTLGFAPDVVEGDPDTPDPFVLSQEKASSVEGFGSHGEPRLVTILRILVTIACEW